MGGRAGRLPPRRRPFADEVSPGSRTVVKYEIIIYWSREMKRSSPRSLSCRVVQPMARPTRKLSTTYK